MTVLLIKKPKRIKKIKISADEEFSKAELKAMNSQ